MAKRPPRRVDIPARWREVHNLIDAVEEIDPDWRDHFFDADHAAEFYERDEDFALLCEQIIREQELP